MNAGNGIGQYGLKEEEKKLLDCLQSAILSYDGKKAQSVTREMMEKKIDPLFVMNYAIANSAKILGDKFESGEIFLPHLVLAGDIMSESSVILETFMTPEKLRKLTTKTIVIGTVQGDIHSIGKNIVAMLMKVNGFTVYDLGIDVKSEVFIREAQAHHADMIALSCLMTATMPYQEEVIEELNTLNLRSKFKVMVGGGPVSEEWANKIGADGFGGDAVEAVKVAQHILGTN